MRWFHIDWMFGLYQMYFEQNCSYSAFDLIELMFLCCIPRFELVKSMLPAEHHKVLANIRKAEARTKRRKQASEQDDDSESEEEAPKAKNERYGTHRATFFQANVLKFPLYKSPVLSFLVLRTSLQSQTVTCQRMKERLVMLRRKQANSRRAVPGSKKERKMTRSTSWTPRFPREYLVINPPVLFVFVSFTLTFGNRNMMSWRGVR